MDHMRQPMDGYSNGFWGRGGFDDLVCLSDYAHVAACECFLSDMHVITICGVSV
jgi:hypothetical protein